MFENSQLKIRRGRRSELFVSCRVVINQFCGFISHLIGCETINFPEIFSGVHGFSGKTVTGFGESVVFWPLYIFVLLSVDITREKNILLVVSLLIKLIKTK